MTTRRYTNLSLTDLLIIGFLIFVACVVFTGVAAGETYQLPPGVQVHDLGMRQLGRFIIAPGPWHLVTINRESGQVNVSPKVCMAGGVFLPRGDCYTCLSHEFAVTASAEIAVKLTNRSCFWPNASCYYDPQCPGAQAYQLFTMDGQYIGQTEEDPGGVYPPSANPFRVSWATGVGVITDGVMETPRPTPEPGSTPRPTVSVPTPCAPRWDGGLCRSCSGSTLPDFYCTGPTPLPIPPTAIPWTPGPTSPPVTACPPRWEDDVCKSCQGRTLPDYLCGERPTRTPVEDTPVQATTTARPFTPSPSAIPTQEDVSPVPDTTPTQSLEPSPTQTSVEPTIPTPTNKTVLWVAIVLAIAGILTWLIKKKQQ